MVKRTIQEGIERVIEQDFGMAFPQHPRHANILLNNLMGDVASSLKRANPDPVLFAYQLRDDLKRMFILLLEVRQWADEYIEATPYDLDKWSKQEPC